MYMAMVATAAPSECPVSRTVPCSVPAMLGELPLYTSLQRLHEQRAKITFPYLEYSRCQSRLASIHGKHESLTLQPRPDGCVLHAPVRKCPARQHRRALLHSLVPSYLQTRSTYIP